MLGLTRGHLSAASQTLNFLLVLATAYMLWKGLSVAADSKSPIVVVLSGSMEPAFHRGDLLLLWNRDGLLPECISCEFTNDYTPPSKSVNVGEVVVYDVRGKDIPIVHRVVRIYPPAGKKSGTRLLTKGDNNAADDVELYARGQSLLDRDEDVVGTVVGYVPLVGYGTIALSEHPWLKGVLLAGMGLMVVLQRE